MKFVREFIRNPRQTGSIAASSAPVVETVLGGLDLTGVRSVVELGAGTGALTDGLLSRLPEGAELLAVELNASFCEDLRRRFPGAAVRVANRSATELPQLTREYRMFPVDVVVSALPWTLMTPADQQTTLNGVVEILAPGGQFVTLTCFHQTLLAPGRRLRELLQRGFGEVSSLPVVWAAVPPMFIYRCTAPRKAVARTGVESEDLSDPV